MPLQLKPPMYTWGQSLYYASHDLFRFLRSAGTVTIHSPFLGFLDRLLTILATMESSFTTVTAELGISLLLLHHIP
jgi:hypothetical protein